MFLSQQITIPPRILDKLRNKPGCCIVILVSLLTASMMVHQKEMKDMCIAAEFIAETKCDGETVMGVEEGHCQLIFISCKQLIEKCFH